MYDALSFTTSTFKFAPDPQNPLNGENPSIHALIDYEQFCGVETKKEEKAGQGQEISAEELKAMLAAGEDFQLLDVREPHEYAARNIGGQLIPLRTLADNLDKVNPEKKVVVHCHSGQRSKQAIRLLQDEGYTNLYNLKGGIMAWTQAVNDASQV